VPCGCLNRPGGNLTGVTALAVEVASKRLQMLHELVPGANPIAFLANPANIANEARVLRNAARNIGVRLLEVEVTSSGDLDPAFRNLVDERAGAFLVAADPLFFLLHAEIASLEVRYAIPGNHYYREAVIAGGLMSYAPNPFEISRVVGSYVGRILKGEKPADLPVQQSTTIEFMINLKTAKALGLTIPETLLATADEVIQ
jgi:putative ABC transport system substrate-binding protein